MGSIYNHSFVTIVAASGNDSWASLPGLRRDTRTIIQHKETVRGITLTNVLRDAGEALVWSD
jgi:hypothetical protein